MTEDGLIVRRGFADAGNRLFRDDQKMNGSLGLDVVEDDAEVVLVLDLGGDFAVDDALEKGFRHGFLQGVTEETESGIRDWRWVG